MTNPQYQALDSICHLLDSLWDRLQRREGHHVSEVDDSTDSHLRKTLDPVRTALRNYKELHLQHGDYQGQINRAHREPFFDVLARAGDAAQDLCMLTENTLNRTGSNSDSFRWMSPMFQMIVSKEHAELRKLRSMLLKILGSDIKQLKNMPRCLPITTPSPEPANMLPAWETLENRISCLFNRVDRRMKMAAASSDDSAIGTSMHRHLHSSLHATQEYIRAYKMFFMGPIYSITQHSRYLKKFSETIMADMTDMMQDMEPSFSAGNTGLSPLFARMAHREYQEILSLMMTVKTNNATEEERMTPQARSAALNPFPPLSPPAINNWIPYILMASGFMAGCGAAQEVYVTAIQQPAPKPRPDHLRLVYSHS